MPTPGARSRLWLAAASGDVGVTGGDLEDLLDVPVGSTRVTGDVVEVAVNDTVPMLLLSLAGVRSQTVSAVEQARIVQGVERAES